ncbi:hypothetical protein GCM10009856_29440 [Mycolicibacterium llatzerense]
MLLVGHAQNTPQAAEKRGSTVAWTDNLVNVDAGWTWSRTGDCGPPLVTAEKDRYQRRRRCPQWDSNPHCADFKSAEMVAFDLVMIPNPLVAAIIGASVYGTCTPRSVQWCTQ